MLADNWADNWAEKINKELDDNVLPFWLDNALDTECGGYIHQLDRQGSPISTQKGMWVHGRFLWLLSWLYRTRRADSQFRDAARLGYYFIRDHGRAEDGRWWYQVMRDGRPLQKRRYLFTEIFITLGLGAYTAIADTDDAERLFSRAFDDLHHWFDNAGRLPQKFEPEVWNVRSHSMTMILINLYQELREVAPSQAVADSYSQKISRQIEEFFRYFVKPADGVVLELVGPDGSIIDTPEGREINPGHAIETAWFILEEADYQNDTNLRAQAIRILDWMFQWGWDKEYGGLRSFCDLRGRPSHHVEADMKYWWPQTEALYASLAAYKVTGDERYRSWFDTIGSYTFDRFPDPDGPEWFGYLFRDGFVANEIKGNLWKGPFHIPRALHKCSMVLSSLTPAAAPVE